MNKPQDIINQSLPELLITTERLGTKIESAQEEVNQLEKQLHAACTVLDELRRESRLVCDYAQQMLKYNGNVEKQAKVKDKYLKLITKSYLNHQKAEQGLQESRNVVRELIENLPAQIAELTQKAVEQSEKDQPKPIVFDKGTVAGILG